MSGPATKMYRVLRALWLIRATLRLEDVAFDGALDGITPERLAVMDIAAEAWAADASRPLLRHAEMLRAALKLELERRKEGGA